MIRLILKLTLLTTTLFAATPKQVDQYLSVSYAEEELIALESDFSAMQRSFGKGSESNTTEYDMQLLSIRFREYLQRNLSEDEMEDILANYKQVVLLQFSSASQVKLDQNASAAYATSLENNSEASNRIALVEEISKKLYTKEAMEILFDKLIKPLFQNGKNNSKVDESYIKQSKKNYLEMMKEESRVETLYVTKEFSLEDLEALLKVAKTSAMDHEVKAVFGATAYALKDFFSSMTKRYDVSKH